MKSLPLGGLVAQRLEQRTHNPLVPGSNPGGPTTVTVRLRRERDDGTITSPLDMEGAFMAVTLTTIGNGRIPDVFADGLAFRRFTLYGGHFIVTLDTRRPIRRCGADVYLQLPVRLTAVR
jgi:hypothetical protein